MSEMNVVRTIENFVEGRGQAMDISQNSGYAKDARKALREAKIYGTSVDDIRQELGTLCIYFSGIISAKDRKVFLEKFHEMHPGLDVRVIGFYN